MEARGGAYLGGAGPINHSALHRFTRVPPPFVCLIASAPEGGALHLRRRPGSSGPGPSVSR